MKKVFVSIAVVLASVVAFAGKVITPMHVVEKSSYQLAGLVSKGKIDASYLTDVTTVTVTQESGGFRVKMYSPSADESNPNTLEMTFDQAGKATSASANFVSRFPHGPLLDGANAATILDLGAEAIVDHLSESSDNVVVAQNVQSVEIQKEATGVLFLVNLNNGQTYSIHMDQDGKVISQGF